MVDTPGVRAAVPKLAPLYGQETAEVAGLALLGVGSKPATAPVTAVPQTGNQEVAASVDELVSSLRREVDSLGMFQRQWYWRTLKQRSGLALEDWEDVSRQIKDNPAAASQYAPDLKRLAAYFSDLKTDARGFIKGSTKA